MHAMQLLRSSLMLCVCMHATHLLTRSCLVLVQGGQWERSEELLGEAVHQGQHGLLQVRASGHKCCII